ncbi:MAG TPA: sigma 54-interacting transcriptional regulator [Longimicrobiales bacterium]|nr:sigma 54-interacting transcriptional regulator [Longimicrobiales bacterium]
MADRVLITTTDLEASVRLRDAFAAHKLPVELLTPSEDVADVEDAALLVLTGGLDQKRARRLAAEAAARDRLPVMALAESAAEAGPALRARLGLQELFVKPVDYDDVALAGQRLIQRRRLRSITGIVGETDAMLEVLERVTQIAPVNSTVLVTGESGTGKELVARGIHALSPRRHRPFIAANVAALAETLLESELFGHEKGAFTGAVAQRKGFFELAHGGTLFLDEIGEMPLTTQTKLLRVLEQREFMRVGGEEPIRVDVRVVAATNQDLRHQVQIGDFRRDLYFRLNVLHIALPPLRERPADIPLLVDDFVRQTSGEHDLAPIVLSPEAMTVLLEYPWPGNIRELRNLIESMVVMMPGRTIAPADIPPGLRGSGQQLMPAPALPRGSDGGEGEGTRPALEFIFRMLLQLRMDVEDLKRGFDEYREQHPSGAPAVALPYPYPQAVLGRDVSVPYSPDPHQPFPEDAGDDRDDELDEDRTVVYQPGMTMRDLEKEAITAALREVAGNRREAAGILGIGERTLYRKIKEYEIPL